MIDQYLCIGWKLLIAILNMRKRLNTIIAEVVGSNPTRSTVINLADYGIELRLF